MLLIGALVAATLFRVQSALRIAREGMARDRADVATERALRVALASTSSATLRSIPIGRSVVTTDVTDGVTTTLTTVRVDTTLAWLVASSTTPSVRGSARAQLGVSAIIASSGFAPLQIIPGDSWTPVY